MLGSAVFTIVVSSRSMKTPETTAVRGHHLVAMRSKLSPRQLHGNTLAVVGQNMKKPPVAGTFPAADPGAHFLNSVIRPVARGRGRRARCPRPAGGPRSPG